MLVDVYVVVETSSEPPLDSQSCFAALHDEA